MKIPEKTAKIYDKDKNLLGVGKLLNLGGKTIKIKGFNLPEINSDTEIYIEIYDELRGITPLLCKVGVASTNQLNAYVIRKDPIIERRSSLKVKTDLSFYIDSLHRAGEDVTKDFINMKINILNLSIGGMLISSNYDLEINDLITFTFKYLKYPLVTIKAKVIRIDKIYDKITNEFSAVNYGCAFEKLSSSEESIIIKYLYDRQLQLYKNR